MNWSGGYKNRFRPRSEILCRKTTFQQQSRIVLVDHVSKGIEEKNQHISNQEPTEILLSSSSLEEPNEEKPLLIHPQFQSPFSNIPNGSSSDSDDSEFATVSDTNYSPYSDQESKDICTIEINSKKEQEKFECSELTNQEDRGVFKSVIYVGSHSQSPETMTLDTSSSFECDSPPYYHNDNSPSGLNFLTPVIHRHNNAKLATPLATKNLCFDDVQGPSIAHSTSVRGSNITKATPARDHTFRETLSNLQDKRKTSVLSNHPLNSHLVVRSDTPVLRKQVRFAADQNLNGNCSEHDSDLSPIIIEHECVVYTSPPVAEKTCEEQPCKETCLASVSDQENIAQEFPNYQNGLKISNMECDAVQDTLERVTPYKRVKKRLLPHKKKLYSFKKYPAPCHCRTVIRKVKIRDAETQTSP